MIHCIKSVLAGFLCLLNICQSIIVKRPVVRIVIGVDRRAGLSVLMENILRGVDHVIADNVFGLPEISHPVVVP